MAVSCYAEDIKIGVVEVDYILKNSKEVLDEKGKLREKFNKLQDDLRKKEKTLKESIADFEAQSSLYSPEAKKEKAGELKSEEEKLVNTFKGYQEEIKKNEQELVKGVVDKVKEILKDKGYSLVIEKNSGYVIYSAPDLDISKVIAEIIDSKKGE
jgi:outer membrane protein